MTVHDAQVAARFRELLEWQLAEDGKRGKVRRVATRLGIHETDVPKILAGKRHIGREVAERAAERIANFDLGFFDGKGPPEKYIRHASDDDLGADARTGLSAKKLLPRGEAVEAAFYGRTGATYGEAPPHLREKIRTLAAEARACALIEHVREVEAADAAQDWARFDSAGHKLSMEITHSIAREPTEQTTQALRRVRHLLSKPDRFTEQEEQEFRRLVEHLVSVLDES